MVSGLPPFWGSVFEHVGSKTRFVCICLVSSFMIIFGIVFGRPLYALWCPKGAQNKVFVDSFRSDFEVSGENENEAPVHTAASFSRFSGTKKAKGFDAIFGRGPRELGNSSFSRF